MTKLNLQHDVLAKAEALGLKARLVVEGLRQGEHKSPYRGFSVEFAQHREYVPGDDLRHIDWKVYGRSERYTVKQYEQETNFAGHLLLDASRSMEYGKGEQNKLYYAKLLSACLSYMVLNQRDAVSLNIFDEAWRTRLPASSQLTHSKAILYALEDLEPKDKTSMGPLLHELAESVRRRGLVFLISDCFEEPEVLMNGIRHLRFAGHEVIIFHILHKDEIDFPFEGHIRFEGLEVKEEHLTRPHLIRPAYQKAFSAFQESLRKSAAAHQTDYVLMRTDEPLSSALSKYLAKRQRQRRI